MCAQGIVFFPNVLQFLLKFILIIHWKQKTIREARCNPYKMFNEIKCHNSPGKHTAKSVCGDTQK